jgi:hypothetical protein
MPGIKIGERSGERVKLDLNEGTESRECNEKRNNKDYRLIKIAVRRETKLEYRHIKYKVLYAV